MYHLKLSAKDLSSYQAGENSSFIFTVCVKLVPRYHFKLAYVILQRIFLNPLLKMEAILIFRVIFDQP